MALEDRYSPQTAPSPHGVPQSPHSTTSPTLLEMHHQQQFMHQTYLSQFEQKITSSPLRSSYSSSDRLSPQSDGNITIKEEVDSIMSDNDHEDQIPVHHIQPSSPPAPLPRISFSITNILSDRFGRDKPEENTQHPTSTVKSPGKSAVGIFRPFENDGNKTEQLIEEKSAFTRITSPPAAQHHIPPADILDYSRRQQIALQQIASQQPQHLTHHQAAAAAAAAVMMAERANFLNCFNPVAYPRIHEEILNSTARKYKHSNQNTEKIPPLGSLCKTVSQIGQNTNLLNNCMSSPPPASVSSSSASPALSSANGSSCSSTNSRIPNSSPQPIPPQSVSRDSGMESSDDTRSESGSTKDGDGNNLWPAWVYCTRYSDRPSSGPRYRRPKQPKDPKDPNDEKRPRTAFSSDQLARLKREFNENRYLTERRRLQLSDELGLNEAQIKIWFQNKRAKIKKTSGSKNPLALQLMAQGLYNHSTVPLTKEEEELEMRMNGQL